MELPHVTAILDAALGPYPMPPMTEAERQWYMDRGTAVHAATVLDDTGELDAAALDPRIVPYVRAWRAARAALRMDTVERELAVTHPQLGYCGRLDWLGYLPGLCGKRLVVLDIKTSDALPRVELQTMAYALAVRRAMRLRSLPARTCVVLRADGTWNIGLGDRAIFGEDQRDAAAWRGCIALAKWRMGRDEV